MTYGTNQWDRRLGTVIEVLEETGWQCEVIKALKDVRYFYIHEKVRYHKTVRWFLMRPGRKVGEPAPDEILECAWETVPAADKLISYSSDKSLLEDLKRELQ